MAKEARNYNNPPVVEVVCEMYFKKSNWDSTIPGLFYEKIKDNFPVKNEIQRVDVKVDIGPNIKRSQLESGNNRLQFIRKDKSQLIQIERDLLVINQLRPYPTYEIWSPLACEMLNLYKNIVNPSEIQRIGVRYINRIIIPHGRFLMEQYFTIFPEIPKSLGAEHGNFLLRLEIPPFKKGHILVITFGTAPRDKEGTYPLMLDLYDQFFGNVILDTTNVKSILDDSHANIINAFENSITDDCRQLFD